jgi:hypothetical protein
MTLRFRPDFTDRYTLKIMRRNMVTTLKQLDYVFIHIYGHNKIEPIDIFVTTNALKLVFIFMVRIKMEIKRDTGTRIGHL